MATPLATLGDREGRCYVCRQVGLRGWVETQGITIDGLVRPWLSIQRAWEGFRPASVRIRRVLSPRYFSWPGGRAGSRHPCSSLRDCAGREGGPFKAPSCN
jgi:hypothetical protein